VVGAGSATQAVMGQSGDRTEPALDALKSTGTAAVEQKISTVRPMISSWGLAHSLRKLTSAIERGH
jgi:hypothetical protein